MFGELRRVSFGRSSAAIECRYSVRIVRLQIRLAVPGRVFLNTVSQKRPLHLPGVPFPVGSVTSAAARFSFVGLRAALQKEDLVLRIAGIHFGFLD